MGSALHVFRMRLRNEWWLAAGALVSLACGEPSTRSGLEVSEQGDVTEFRATWQYASFELDVDLSLTTLESEDSCTSRGSLVVNDVVSATERYALAPTDCSLLRLDEHGDIVMSEQPTGYDWTQEELAVDTDREIMTLGPVALIPPESTESVSHRFALSNPPCSDDAECNCAALERFAGETRLTLPLGRKCE
jgi:hypothetical protein